MDMITGCFDYNIDKLSEEKRNEIFSFFLSEEREDRDEE
jgi:hypothetical protein